MYAIKNLKHFKGHEGEPCAQGSLHGPNGKVAEWSDSGTGGCMHIRFNSHEEEKAFETWANKFLHGKPDYDGTPIDTTQPIMDGVVDRTISFMADAIIKVKAEQDAIKKGYIAYYSSVEGSRDAMYSTNIPYTPANVAQLHKDTPALTSIINETHKQAFADEEKLRKEEENKRYRKMCKTVTLFSLKGDDGTVNVMQNKAAYSSDLAASIKSRYPNLVEIINERFL